MTPLSAIIWKLTSNFASNDTIFTKTTIFTLLYYIVIYCILRWKYISNRDHMHFWNSILLNQYFLNLIQFTFESIVDQSFKSFVGICVRVTLNRTIQQGIEQPCGKLFFFTFGIHFRRASWWHYVRRLFCIWCIVNEEYSLFIHYFACVGLFIKINSLYSTGCSSHLKIQILLRNIWYLITDQIFRNFPIYFKLFILGHYWCKISWSKFEVANRRQVRKWYQESYSEIIMLLGPFY